jgi:quinol monooxygenase YgiN
MLLIIGTIRLPADGLDAAREAMTEMVLASRAEPGCIEYGYAQDILDPGLIHVKERWASRAALERHFQSDHIARWRASWPKLGISDRSLTLYAPGEPEPI